MGALSSYNEMEKELYETHRLCLEKRVDLAITKKNIYQSFREMQREYGIEGQQ